MPIRPRTPPKSRPGILRHWTLWAWFVLALLLSAGGVCLWRSGRMLVREDGFGHVPWALVLAGESRDCERSDAAIRLFKEGRIDTLILSSTRVFKNRYHSEFMVDYMVRQGVPRDRIFEFHQDAYSTQEEAALLVGQFRLLNLDTVLIITTSYHTARTGRIFRKLAQGNPVILVTAAEYPIFDPAAWWTNRESRKLWFDEWAKTFFTAFELWNAAPIAGKAEYQGLIPDPSAAGTGAPAPQPFPADTSESAPPDTSVPASASEGAAGEGAGPEGAANPSDSARAATSVGSEAAGDSARAATGGREPGGGVGLGLTQRVGKAEAKAEEPKPGKDSAGGDGRAERDTVARKPTPKPAKKPAAPAPKAPAKHEEKKTEKNRKKG